MSANQAGHPAEGPTTWAHAVRVVKAEHLDPNTPQTSGMHRAAAVSGETVGSKGIWAGITDVAPHAATGTHHHGEQETVIYVVSGQVRMRWGDRLEHEADAGAGGTSSMSPPSFRTGRSIRPTRPRSGSSCAMVTTRSSSISSPSTMPNGRPPASLIHVCSAATADRLGNQTLRSWNWTIGRSGRPRAWSRAEIKRRRSAVATATRARGAACSRGAQPRTTPASRLSV